MLRQPTFKWWKCNFVWSTRAQLLSWIHTSVAECFRLWLINTISIPIMNNLNSLDLALLFTTTFWLTFSEARTMPESLKGFMLQWPPSPHPTTPPWKPLWQTTNISRSHCTLRHLPLPSPIYLQQRPTTLTDTFSVCLAPTILRSSSTQRKEAYHFRKRRWHETAHITQH